MSPHVQVILHLTQHYSLVNSILQQSSYRPGSSFPALGNVTFVRLKWPPLRALLFRCAVQINIYQGKHVHTNRPHPINCQQISQMSFGMLSLFSPDLTTYIDNEPLVEPFPQWQPERSMSRSSVLAQIRAPLLIRGTDCALLVFFFAFQYCIYKMFMRNKPCNNAAPCDCQRKTT